MAKEVSNNSGLVSVIFGILGLLSIILTIFALTAPIFGLILSVLGLVFGLVQSKTHKNNWSKAGIIISIIGIILNGVVLIIEFQFLSRLIEEAKPAMEAARQQQELLSQYAQQTQ